MNNHEQWASQVAEAADISLARTPDGQNDFAAAFLDHDEQLTEEECEALPASPCARGAFLLAALHVLVYKHVGRAGVIIAVVPEEGEHSDYLPCWAEVDPASGFHEYAALVCQNDSQRTDVRSQLRGLGWSPRIAFRHASSHTSLPDPQPSDQGLEFLLEVHYLPGKLSTRLRYDQNRFTSTAVDRLTGAYLRIVKQALNGNPSIRQIDATSQADRKLILGPFNDTDTAFPGATFHGLFEAQVERVPDSFALVDESVTLTYLQANQRANQIAHLLIELGVRRNDVVGVIVGRTVDALTAMLAVMKAGAAYLPIEPGFPAERTAYMLLHSHCKFALIEPALAKKVPLPVMAIDLTTPLIAEKTTGNPGLPVDLNDLAYVIYTSGSTGEPKGVPIHHEGVANLHHIFRDRFAISEHDRMTEFASFSFDTSVWEIVMCLLSGAALHILPDALKSNYAKVEQYIIEHQITVATFPPTYLCYMDPERTPSLRKVAVAGSECSAKLLRQWNNRVDFFNAYGPTEHTVCVAVFNAPKGPYEADVVPIGRPLFNKRIYIVGVDGQLQPIGASGELWVSGVGASRGYIGRPDLTHERFILNPFQASIQGPYAAKHAIAYRTGDLVRWREDGSIEFIGRLDNQVKVRGYRIELDEVDSALLKVPGIVQAGSIVKKGDDGTQVLIGFYTASGTLHAEAVRDSLAARVPEFMIPSRIVQISTMPMTNSDKVDRKALAAVVEQAVDLPWTTASHGAVNPTVKFIRTIALSVLNQPSHPDQWPDGTRLQTMGVDSLQFMKIVVGMEKEFEIEFEDDFLLNGRSMTLAEIAQLIDERTLLQ